MARKNADTLSIDTMHLEGALFVPDILDKAAKGEHTFQKTEDYRIPKGLKLHDEYGRSFQIAKAQWQAFDAHRGRKDLSPDDLTRRFITEFLKDALGYADIRPMEPMETNNRTYPVTAMACGRVPVVIAAHTLDLDDPSERFAVTGGGARKASASRLAQMFLDASPECTWAIVSNGKHLRLQRDTAVLTRPTFLTFDLETLFTENRYADFAALWRILHASRAGAPETAGEDCVWELWREEGKEQGTRVREYLRHGVTQGLLALGTGFIENPANTDLRTLLYNGDLSKNDFFQELLRLIYRFLFVFTVEERGILHTGEDGPATETAKTLYAEGYALRRLRDKALRRVGFDGYGDLWQAVRIVFRGLSNGEPRLALPALGGLFAASQCPNLDKATLSNKALLTAMRHLRWSGAQGTLSPVDYRNMGPEELGSVYESLLELVPHIDLVEKHFGFVGLTDDGLTSGHDRKTTGSYYTDDRLVQELIRSALTPVIEQKISENPENPVDAVLSISVIDPSCGSGHFLLSAARRLAERVAELSSIDGAVRPQDYRNALRTVIARSIYGVDKNPMAVELARTALWLEGYEPGKALSFMDHHLVCGDSLLGIMDFRQLEKGIPDDAFKTLSGDDGSLCGVLKRDNKAYRQILSRRKLDTITLGKDITDALSELKAIEAMPDQTPDQVVEKENAYREFLETAKNSRLSRASDLWVSAFLMPKDDDGLSGHIPTTRHLITELFEEGGDDDHLSVVEKARELCAKARVLNWPLTFPRIFATGGFDCVLGNPPWERIKLQEQEFFATRSQDVALAKNKAERARRIAWLEAGMLARNLYPETDWSEETPKAEQRIYREFQFEKRSAEAQSLFAHVKGEDGGRFPLTGRGDVNTYALFAETNLVLTHKKGRSGFIVPTGIATDDSTKFFFGDITQNSRLVSLFDFENREAIFPGVHRSYKFCLMTLGTAEEARFAFFLTRADQLNDGERVFSLAASDFLRINPNTRTCPIFRSRMDAEITRKIYSSVPVLIRDATDEDKEQNPWGISFSAMFHMSNDSGLFKSHGGPDTLPLYEAKMIHQFDHRWAGYRGHETGEPSTVDISIDEKTNPAFTPLPRYYVDKRQVLARIADVPKSVAKAYADGDETMLLAAMANWIDAHRNVVETESQTRDALIRLGGPAFNDLPQSLSAWKSERLQNEARQVQPLSPEHMEHLKQSTDIRIALDCIMDERSPRWLMGWRDICRATDERTVIASVVPRAGAGDTLLLMFPKIEDKRLYSCLLAEQNSIPHDFVARQKIGGTHLKYHVKKQIVVLPPESYTQTDIEFIVPRVLELTYTTHDLKPWAEDLGYSGEPFPFDPERRAHLRAELDAYYAKLYGLTLKDLCYILDPSEVMGEDYPSETFRVLKNNEIRDFGEYRFVETNEIGGFGESRIFGKNESREFVRYRTSHLVIKYFADLTKPTIEQIATTSYPGNPFNRFICSLTLSLVEIKQPMKSMDILDALIVMKQPIFSQVFLSATENKEMYGLFIDAGLAGQAESPVHWVKCRDYLENTRYAIQINRTHTEQIVSKGANFEQTKATLPQIPDRFVSLLLKTLSAMYAAKRKADVSNENQNAMIRYLESEKERLAS